MNYAVINGNTVINIIVADTLEIAEAVTNLTCVELPEIGFGIGDLWDGVKFTKTDDQIAKATKEVK